MIAQRYERNIGTITEEENETNENQQKNPVERHFDKFKK